LMLKEEEIFVCYGDCLSSKAGRGGMQLVKQ
jgi:hypothetical protein